MAGAAALCGASALRSGAGLVRIACPAEIQTTVASFEPCYMTYPLPCDEHGMILLLPAQPVLERLIAPADVIAVGPGLGQSEDIRRLLRFLITGTSKPLIIDADGLNALVGQTELLSKLKSTGGPDSPPRRVRPADWKTTADVQADRVHRAASLAALAGPLVIVLKGAGTVISDGRRYSINTTGNPGMATAGTGDVLTGVIAALIGQKLPAFEAAQLGVFIHGLAGDVARDQNGEIGLIAGDIVDALPDAFVHAMPEPDPDLAVMRPRESKSMGFGSRIRGSTR